MDHRRHLQQGQGVPEDDENVGSQEDSKQSARRDSLLLDALLQNSAMMPPAPPNEQQGLQQQHAAFMGQSVSVPFASGRIGALPPPQPHVDQRIAPLLSQLSPYGFLGGEMASSQGPVQQQPAQVAQPSFMLSSGSILDRVVLPPNEGGVAMPPHREQQQAKPPGPKSSGGSVAKFQVVPLSEREKKAGFPFAASGKEPKVLSLTRYKRTWERLSAKAETSRSAGSSFVPEFFSRSIARDKNADHLYRKIHGLPSSDQGATRKPAKRIRHS